jgi:hypothetical protein
VRKPWELLGLSRTSWYRAGRPEVAPPPKRKGRPPSPETAARTAAERRRVEKAEDEAAAWKVRARAAEELVAALRKRIGAPPTPAAAPLEAPKAAAGRDPGTLSMTAQQKLQAAIAQEKAKLQADFHNRVNARVHEFWHDTFAPLHRKEQSEAMAVMQARKGVMDKLTYRKILACLHTERLAGLLNIPHGQLDAGLAERYRDAFNLFTAMEKRLLAEKDSPTSFQNIPGDLGEYMKARRKGPRARKQQMKVR